MQEYARKNLQDAFVGEADPLSEGANTDPHSPESVEFRVVSGTFRAQVPAHTETIDVIGPDRFYEADLVLEDGTRVAIQIAQGAEGVNILQNGKTTSDLSAVGTKDTPTHESETVAAEKVTADQAAADRAEADAVRASVAP